MAINDGYKLYCCGSRGSRSVEGQNFNEFGGGTSCYILKRRNYAMVLDCGTGLYAAMPLLADCTVVDVLITHMHYDHILGLLDFGRMPSKAKVTVYAGFDEWFGDKTIDEFFRVPFWPIVPKINIQNAPPEGEPLSLNNNDLFVRFYPAPHPNGAKILLINQGSIDDRSRQIALMVDCEKADALPDDLVLGSNILIYDGMYTAREYPSHVGWGHSTWQEGTKLALKVGCKRLIITHHEPMRTDVELRECERDARKTFPKTDFARAGQYWDFPILSPKEAAEPNPAKKKKTKSWRFMDLLIARFAKFLKKLEDIFVTKQDSYTTNLISAIVLGGVSFFMTVVNIFTDRKILMLSTLFFSIYCAIYIVLLLTKVIGEKAATVLFQIGIIALFTFFIVSGEPEGFSIIWLFLLPAAGLFVFGIRTGTVMCAIMLAILIFFFQIPYGQKFLMFDYSRSFRLRFPMGFTAFYLLSLFLENVRQKTSAALQELKDNQDGLISKQTAEIRDQNMELLEFNSKLQLRNELLNKTFGRFLPDEVISGLLETSEGFELTGEKRLITVLQSDLRGFSCICNHMDPFSLVDMLNHYLGAMSDIVQRHNGTILEFIGDAVMVIFGAPNDNPNHADDAIACAVEMQACMAEVNHFNSEHGYDHLDIGIGIHTGEAILGTIGSERHLKYDAIGNTINLGNRIESYATGGQVLVSEETLRYVTSPVAVSDVLNVMPKGSFAPMSISNVTGIGGKYQLSAPIIIDEQKPLAKTIHVKFVRVEDKHCEMTLHEGDIVADSPYGMTLRTTAPIKILDDIRLQCGCAIIGKIIKVKDNNEFVIRYTSRKAKFKGFDQCACEESEQYFSFNLN